MTPNKGLKSFMHIPKFSHPVPSPDGDHISVFKCEGNAQILQIIDLKSGSSVTTIENVIEEQPKWDPTGDHLYYQKRVNGTSDIYMADVQGDSELVVSPESKCVLEDMSPDGQFLYYTTGQALFRFDFNKQQAEQILESVNFVPGTDYPFSRGSVFCSPDGTRIVYTIGVAGSAEAFHPIGKIHLAKIDGTEARELSIQTDEIPTGKESLLVRDWHPDGHRLLIASHPFAGYCGIYNIEQENTDWFGADLNASDVPFSGLEVPLRFYPTGSAFVAWRLQGDRKVLANYTLNNEADTIELGGEVRRQDNRHPQFLQEDALVIVRENKTEPGDLIAVDVSSGTPEPLLKSSYGNVNPDQIVEPILVSYETADGGTAPGVLYESDEQQSPAIVEVYSGYHLESGWPREFRPDIQYLVANGYTVFQAVNPAQSFTDESHAHNAAAGEWIKERDSVNGDRVAVYGFSLGGYDSLIQAFRYPETWAACVSGDGFPDLFEADERRNGIAEIRRNLGDPEDNEHKWHAQNPVDELERMTKGEHCPLFLWATGHKPEEPFKHLRDLVLDHSWTEDDDFQYLYLGDQGHIPESPKERIKRWRHIITFFDKSL